MILVFFENFEEDDGEMIFDSVTGVALLKAEVWKAREEESELRWVEKQQDLRTSRH